jgi:hypothetical protein
VYRSESESSTGQICLDGLFFSLKTACQKGAGNTGEEIDMRGYSFLTEVRLLALAGGRADISGESYDV